MNVYVCTWEFSRGHFFFSRNIFFVNRKIKSHTMKWLNLKNYNISSIILTTMCVCVCFVWLNCVQRKIYFLVQQKNYNYYFFLRIYNIIWYKNHATEKKKVNDKTKLQFYNNYTKLLKNIVAVWKCITTHRKFVIKIFFLYTHYTTETFPIEILKTNWELKINYKKKKKMYTKIIWKTNRNINWIFCNILSKSIILSFVIICTVLFSNNKPLLSISTSH